MKEFVFPKMFAMEIRKRQFFNDHINDCEKCFIKKKKKKMLQTQKADLIG